MTPITESELYGIYLRGGWDDVYDFPTFMAKCELKGMIITKEADAGNSKNGAPTKAGTPFGFN